MTESQLILFCKVQEQIAVMEAYKIKNTYRLSKDLSPAYGEDKFFTCADLIRKAVDDYLLENR